MFFFLFLSLKLHNYVIVWKRNKETLVLGWFQFTFFLYTDFPEHSLLHAGTLKVSWVLFRGFVRNKTYVCGKFAKSILYCLQLCLGTAYVLCCHDCCLLAPWISAIIPAEARRDSCVTLRCKWNVRVAKVKLKKIACHECTHI